MIFVDLLSPPHYDQQDCRIYDYIRESLEMAEKQNWISIVVDYLCQPTNDFQLDAEDFVDRGLCSTRYVNDDYQKTN